MARASTRSQLSASIRRTRTARAARFRPRLRPVWPMDSTWWTRSARPSATSPRRSGARSRSVMVMAPSRTTGHCHAWRWVSEIEIRAAEPSDAEALYDIFNCPNVIANTLQIPWRTLEYRRERLAHAQPDVHQLVATIDGRVVGQLGLHLEQTP